MIKIDVKKNLGQMDLNVNLEIKDSEIFGIIGESGSGKTTLLNILQKIESFEGDVSISDNISTIFQEFNLLNNLTVFENIALPLRIKKKYDKSIILSVLEFVNLLDKKDQYPCSLSGGQKQKVAIARAIVENPSVLLCDEPTASLDKKSVKEICDLFKRINEKYKTTIIIVTHELDVAKYICNRVCMLKNGNIEDIIEVNNSKVNIDSYYDYARKVLK